MFNSFTIYSKVTQSAYKNNHHWQQLASYPGSSPCFFCMWRGSGYEARQQHGSNNWSVRIQFVSIQLFPHKRMNKSKGLYTPSIYTLQKGLGYFNHILVTSVAFQYQLQHSKTLGLLQPHFSLSELDQCDQGMLPKRFNEGLFQFHQLASSFRRIIWLHSWHYYHNHNNNNSAGIAVSQTS